MQAHYLFTMKKIYADIYMCAKQTYFMHFYTHLVEQYL